MSIRYFGDRAGARALALATTSGPTRNVNTFLLIPQMTVTLTTTGGNLLIHGQITLSVQNGDNSEITLFVDGAEPDATIRSRNQLTGLLGGTNVQTATVEYLTTGLAAGSHTVEMHWRAVAGTARADALLRKLMVLEVF